MVLFYKEFVFLFLDGISYPWLSLGVGGWFANLFEIVEITSRTPKEIF
jgi:hypothetical protein